jgi:F-type H+-transporting ATPase subunit epsilon
MSDKLHFSLVSPERELYAGYVDQVIAPGEAGEFGVLVNHAPLMSTLSMGLLKVIDAGAEKRFFVRGGFADVTPAGLTVLAEEAIDLADVDAARLEQEIRDAEEDLKDTRDDAQRSRAGIALERLKALKAAVA